MDQSRSLIKVLLGYAVPLVIVALLVGLLAWLGGKQDDVAPAGSLARDVSAEDWQLGTTGAPLTLVEYSDFQCPTCGAFHPIVQQLVDDYAGQILFVYRHFPLQELHKNAVAAATATEAAGVQGKFWEMHNKIFETQDDWSSSKDAITIFTTYALDLGLNVEQFTNDLTSKAVENAVQADYDSGLSSHISGTPTFFLNGQEIADLPRGYDAFKAILDAKLLELGIASNASSGNDTGTATP